MSVHANQPYQTPRIPGSSRARVMSRSNIMGTGPGEPPWTMFMPGQSSGKRDEYPTEWPAAGRLIRVPKCVFLTSCPPAHLWGETFALMSKWAPFGYFGHHYDAERRDIRVNPEPIEVLPAGNLQFDGFVGGYSYIGWTIDPRYPANWNGPRKFNKCCVVQNAIFHEHNRLIDAFQEAKAYLESRYPNDVYVQICEFFPNEPVRANAPLDELEPHVLDVYSASGHAANTPSAGANGPVWLLGPDELTTGPDGSPACDFFGTNFLHIYCGYQATGGTSEPKSAEDAVSRYHWPYTKWGYKLDRDFSFGYDQWVEVAAVPGGYQGWAYDATLNTLRSDMGSSDPEEALASPTGKLDKLRVGFRNFSGYSVRLHEYDCSWSFPPAKFLEGAGVNTHFWPRAVTYGDQDWVEQTIIIAYSAREWIYLNSPAVIYGDEFFPGPEGLDGDGFANHTIRYPGGDSYENEWIPRLEEQRRLLMEAVLGLGPKTVDIWNELFASHGLGELGFSYGGGSSGVTAASIISSVEEHFGLS